MQAIHAFLLRGKNKDKEYFWNFGGTTHSCRRIVCVCVCIFIDVLFVLVILSILIMIRLLLSLFIQLSSIRRNRSSNSCRNSSNSIGCSNTGSTSSGTICEKEWICYETLLFTLYFQDGQLVVSRCLCSQSLSLS